MRIALSLLLLMTLGAAACGASQPPPATPEAAPPADATPSATSAPDADPSKPVADEDGWEGEKAAKNGDTKASGGAEAASDAAPAHGKGPETRTMEVIRQLVMANRKAARKCYEDARKDLKDLQGDVTIHFVLDPEGNVKSAELNQERSTLKSPAVVNCVVAVIKGIKFPKSSRAMETSTNYPFNFTP